jgi:hypothetical protein
MQGQDNAHGKQLVAKDAMRSTLARTCHDPWQLNHAIGRPGPSEDVSNRRTARPPRVNIFANQASRLNLRTIRYTMGGARCGGCRPSRR